MVSDRAETIVLMSRPLRARQGRLVEGRNVLVFHTLQIEGKKADQPFFNADRPIGRSVVLLDWHIVLIQRLVNYLTQLHPLSGPPPHTLHKFHSKHYAVQRAVSLQLESPPPFFNDLLRFHPNAWLNGFWPVVPGIPMATCSLTSAFGNVIHQMRARGLCSQHSLFVWVRWKNRD